MLLYFPNFVPGAVYFPKHTEPPHSSSCWKIATQLYLEFWIIYWLRLLLAPTIPANLMHSVEQLIVRCLENHVNIIRTS